MRSLSMLCVFVHLYNACVCACDVWACGGWVGAVCVCVRAYGVCVGVCVAWLHKATVCMRMYVYVHIIDFPCIGKVCVISC